MSEDIMRRLRVLPPELADPGDRFEQVRARVRRRRRRLAVVAAAVGTVVVGAGVPVGLALTGEGLGRTTGPAAGGGTPTCPQTFGGTAPWVPQKSSGVDGRSRLVPEQPANSAVVCAYNGSNTDQSPSGWTLSGSRVLSSGLDRLADDLTWLPRRLSGLGPVCTLAGGPQVNYLIGLSYPDGVLWVSTAREPNACVQTSNGEFTSPLNVGEQVGVSYDAGRWMPVPPPQIRPTDRDPCRLSRVGRLGQETTMVPGDPISAQVCEVTLAGRVDFRTRTATRGYRGLVEALKAPPTQPREICRGFGKPTVWYEVLFRYAEGPPVLVRVDPNCDPAIDNQSLQARDASTVIPLIRQLLGS